MAETIYDMVIIGGGPGGYTTAIRAGQYGLKVALIEREKKLGGTCLHWGCIPTKSLLFDAEIYDHLKHAAEHGIEGVGAVTINWKTILDRKNGIITKHVKGLDFLMRKNKVTTIEGYWPAHRRRPRMAFTPSRSKLRTARRKSCRPKMW